MKEVIHECKYNDNRIKFVLDDDIVEEIHVQTHDSKSWLVISMNDLLLGLSKSSQLSLINHFWLSAKNNCTEKCTCHAECRHADELIGCFHLCWFCGCYQAGKSSSNDGDCTEYVRG